METLQRAANAGSVSTGFDIDNSLKFEADNTEIIYRTNESGTNRKTFTVSAWFKRTELGVDQQVWHGGTNGEATRMGIQSYEAADENLWVDVGGGSGNTGTLYRSFSTLKIRDTSAWYHVCVAVDTTQATEANRMKVWLNGVEVTSWSQRQYPTQDFQCALESGTEMAWGGYRPSNVVLFSGYIAECHYLDGVAKVQTDFGEYDEDSGIWIPKAYAGTYGDNGCYLNFDDSASLGADSSGNSNTFTLNNIAAADQATDTPTNNFATFNVLQNKEGSFVFTEGATTFNTTTPNQFRTNLASIAVTNGKWYAEFSGAFSNNSFCGVGVMDQVNSLETSYLGAQANTTAQGMGYYSSNGNFYRNTASGAWGDSYTTNDIIGVALDYRSDGTAHMYVAKNGTWQNSSNPATDTNPLSLNYGAAFAAGTFLAIGASIYDNDAAVTCNFGGYTTDVIASAASDANGYGTFEYAPPTGYYALCTKNLAEFG